MLIPQRILPHFKTTLQKRDGDNNLIEGTLFCCNSHDFEVFVVGNIQHNVCSKTCLLPDNDSIVLEVRCKKCGKSILVFDNSCDGYEQCWNSQRTNTTPKYIDCKKCMGDSFSVVIRYEYPNIQELRELEIAEIDNAFTWIWVTLQCNKCGTRYKNFVDYETA